MKRISGCASASSKERQLVLLISRVMIPPVVKLSGLIPTGFLQRTNSKPLKVANSSGRRSTTEAERCSNCKSAEVRAAPQLFAIDQRTCVFQLIPEGTLVTLKGGFALQCFGRLRSLKRDIHAVPEEENLRA